MTRKDTNTIQKATDQVEGKHKLNNTFRQHCIYSPGDF